MRPVLIAAVVLAGCAVGSAIRPARSQPPEQLPDLKVGSSDVAPAPSTGPRPYGLNDHRFAHRPATSCAAASCHGGGAVGKVGSEHSTWAPEAFPQGSQDPHAKAYRVLFNPVSVEMARKLYGDDRPAHTAPTCLKCHAVESGAAPDVADQVRSEGVGCGGCHGPADKWIGEHYTPAWKQLTAREKWEKYGFVPAGNLVARTLNCAGCHVGDGDRDLNHDLYAAGHPRITFEPARLHHQEDYRKHWNEKIPQPDFEVRLWLVGQVAALRAATNLLHERAGRASEKGGDPKTPWPEFAGYSCYSCHERVGEGEAAVRSAISDSFKTRRLGVPAWETWAGSTLDLVAKYCKEVYPNLSSPDLAPVLKLQKTMGMVGEDQKGLRGRMSAPAADVKRDAKAALDALDAWLAAIQIEEDKSRAKPLDPKKSAELAADLAAAIAGDVFANPTAKKGETKLKDHDWDALASRYLGCAAVFHATGGKAGWEPQLLAVKKELAFPERLKDPATGKWKGPRFDSPAEYNRPRLEVLRGLFEDLRDATKTTKGGN